MRRPRHRGPRSTRALVLDLAERGRAQRGAARPRRSRRTSSASPPAASGADPEEVEALAARAQVLAEGWDRPADAPDPDDVDDEVPDDSIGGPQRPTRSTTERRSSTRSATACAPSSPPGPEAPRSCPSPSCPTPSPGPGEVRRSTVAADRRSTAPTCCSGRGFYPPPPGASDVLGLECSGTVAAVGDGVDGLAVGDEVVRAARGRRLRHPGRRARRPADAGARRASTW